MTKNKNTFTIVELLVVISIMIIWASILLPALSRAKETGKRISCIGNLKQVYLTFRMYSNDYNGWYPGYNTTAGFWTCNLTSLDYAGKASLKPRPYGYVISPIFKCPSDSIVWEGIDTGYWNLSNCITSYGLNGDGASNTDLFWAWQNNVYVNERRLDLLGIKIMITDGKHYYGPYGVVYGPKSDIINKYSRVFFTHNNLANVLFTDGHIRSGNWNQIYGQSVNNSDFRWRYDSPNY